VKPTDIDLCIQINKIYNFTWESIYFDVSG